MSGLSTDAERRYTPRGTTWKPCPACKEERNRPLDDVCSDCRRKLDRHDLLVEALRLAAADRQTYHVQQRGPHYFLPQHNPRGPFDSSAVARLGGEDRPTVRSELEAAMVALAEAAGEEDRRPESQTLLHTSTPRLWADRAAQRYDWYHGTRRLYTPETAAAFDRLDRAIRAALVAAWTEGRQHGSSLLAGIAEGSLSVEDFNKRTMEGAK